MMTFYMTPGSCSTAIHILLEELDLIFAATIVDMPRGDHLKPEFLKLNPRGTVPVLVLDDGEALTDFITIARWLADNHPKAKLMPEGAREQARALHLMSQVVETIHGEGYTRIFTKERYGVSADELEAVEKEGRAIVSEGLDQIADAMPEKGYLFGEFSIADATLFYPVFWASRIGLAVPEKIKTHFELMCKRPKVQQVLAEEGYRI